MNKRNALVSVYNKYRQMGNQISKLISKVPQRVMDIVQVFHDASFQCVIVGGALRDIMLNKVPVDFDLATDAIVSEIQKKSKAIKSDKEVSQVGTIASNGDEEVGKMISVLI